MANYEVEVLVNGKPVKQFRHKGDKFVEGRKGSRFEIRFTNNTWRRVEVVPSVDGLSVIDGKPSGTSSEGYIVSGRDSIIIPGWRLNDDAVAEFVFNDKERSYTNQTGHGKTNAGVLGFMVFEEEVTLNYPIPINPLPLPWPKPQPPIHPWPVHPIHPWPVHPYDPYQPHHWRYGNNSDDIVIGSTTAGNPKEGLSETMSGDSIDTFGMSSNSISATGSLSSSTRKVKKSAIAESEAVFELGTGWGDELEHKVVLVEFTRHDAYNPNELLVIYYDTRKGLENRGIRVVQTKKKRVKKLPDAFPTYSSSGATPPPGWKGRRR